MRTSLVFSPWNHLDLRFFALSTQNQAKKIKNLNDFPVSLQLTSPQNPKMEKLAADMAHDWNKASKQEIVFIHCSRFNQMFSDIQSNILFPIHWRPSPNYNITYNINTVLQYYSIANLNRKSFSSTAPDSTRCLVTSRATYCSQFTDAQARITILRCIIKLQYITKLQT